MPKFVENIIISGKLELKTGLHIGGLKESVEIGGIDNPVITTFKKYRDGEEVRVERVPYIPGSTLKGKMRALLELAYANDIKSKDGSCSDGYVMIGDNCIKYESEKSKLIPKIFGVPANSEGSSDNLTRIIVRDAMPTDETINEWKNNPYMVGGTEVKPENAINRITSRANPRFFERVPASSTFEFEIVLSVYEGDSENEMLNIVLDGMKRLENSYIGGMGSRGYGKIEFHIDKIVRRSSEYYKTGKGEKKIFEGGTIDELLRKQSEKEGNTKS